MSDKNQSPAATDKPDSRTGSSTLGVRMDDVARLARVSRATVSRVLTGTAPVSEETRERVHRAVRELSYVPNMNAQGLAGKASGLIGLMLRDPANPAYGLLHAELQTAVARHNLQLITTSPAVGERADSELLALHRMLGMRVSGLMVATGVVSAHDLEPFLASVPVISVGRVEDHPAIHAVSNDEDTNGAIIADQVASNGHRDVAVVIPSRTLSVNENRRGTAIAAHLDGRGVRVRRLTADVFGSTHDRLDDVMTLARSHDITAAMFPNDARAVSCLERARAEGLDVPRDLSVTGLDGAAMGIELIGLATVRLSVKQVAERAVQLMAELLHDRASVPVRHEVIRGTFVPGTSLSAPSRTS